MSADSNRRPYGRDLRRGGQAGERRIGLGGARGGRRLGRGSRLASPRSRIELGSALEHACLERVGALHAAGDAREDHREVDGAEAAQGEDGLGGGALADGGGEFAAVVDQPADQAEQAATAGWLLCGGRSRLGG